MQSGVKRLNFVVCASGSKMRVDHRPSGLALAQVVSRRQSLMDVLEFYRPSRPTACK